MKDLNHSDWLLNSIKKIMESIDPTISVSSITTSSGGKRIFIYGINQIVIEKIYFLTNTDQNNNYLYLEDFKVYIDQHYGALDIPGLKEIMISMYNHSDIFSFLSGNKTQYPFTVKNILNTDYKGKTFSGYIDYLSASIPYVQHSEGHFKQYSITLNTDNNFNPYRGRGLPPPPP
jgi:hypothetical protein